MSYIFWRVVRNTWWVLLIPLFIAIYGFFDGTLNLMTLALIGGVAGWFFTVLGTSIFEYFSVKKLAEMSGATIEMVAYAIYHLGWQKEYIQKYSSSFRYELSKYMKE